MPKNTSPNDPSDMRGLVMQWPELLQRGHAMELPDLETVQGFDSVICCGMGGSAIGAEIISNLLPSPVPFSVNREYDLPAVVAKDGNTLVVLMSHSGSTEETVSCYQQAGERNVRRLVISTGGPLAGQASADGVALIEYEFDTQPRAALPLTLGIWLRLYPELLYSDNPVTDMVTPPSITETALEQAAATVGQRLASGIPEADIAAVRGRIPFIYGAELTSGAARRLKGQISENANQTAGFEILPEQNHNGLVGLEFPDPLADHLAGIFLRTTHEHPQVTKRFDLTQALFAERGLPVVELRSDATDRLAALTELLAIGDLLSVELAYANGVDPTPVDVITSFKAELAGAESA